MEILEKYKKANEYVNPHWFVESKKREAALIEALLQYRQLTWEIRNRWYEEGIGEDAKKIDRRADAILKKGLGDDIIEKGLDSHD